MGQWPFWVKGLGLGDEVQGFGVFEGFRFTDLASILRGTLLRFFFLSKVYVLIQTNAAGQ